jgi:hypothetical protein
MPTEAYLNSQARGHVNSMKALEQKERLEQPTTGRHLYAWLKRLENDGNDVFAFVAAFGRQRGFAPRVVDWAAAGVCEAAAAVRKFLAEPAEPLEQAPAVKPQTEAPRPFGEGILPEVDSEPEQKPATKLAPSVLPFGPAASTDRTPAPAVALAGRIGAHEPVDFAAWLEVLRSALDLTGTAAGAVVAAQLGTLANEARILSSPGCPIDAPTLLERRAALAAVEGA